MRINQTIYVAGAKEKVMKLTRKQLLNDKRNTEL